MKAKEEERGITLVALILTVILLVILSAVGISVVYNSRIIEFAINGTMKYGQEGINENKVLEGTENKIDSVVENIKDIERGSNIESEQPPTLPELANTAPTKAEVSYNTKGTNYIKVNAKSTDVDGDKLTYTLRYGTEQNNLNLSTDLINQTQNEQVTIQTLEELSEYTYYYWRVDVSDGKLTAQGDVQPQVRTYCVASFCEGGTRQRNDCDTRVIVQCSGPFQVTGYNQPSSPYYGESCGTCGGDGTRYASAIKCLTCIATYNSYACYDHKTTVPPNFTHPRDVGVCPTCNGNGFYFIEQECLHGYRYEESHYYCIEHNYKGILSFHE